MDKIFAIIIISIAGCSSASLSEEFCERLDSCNAIRGSVEECIDNTDKVLDDLPAHSRDEVEYAFKQCLERPSCNGFTSCVLDI